LVILIRRADQSELAFIGNGEADAPVGILEDVAAVMVIELVDHDVAALDHADLVGVVLADDRAQYLAHPWSAGIDQELGRHLALPAFGILEGAAPRTAVTARGNAARARSYIGAAVGGIARREDDKPRILDPAVRIFEAAGEFGFERSTRLIPGEIDTARRRQDLAAAEMIVKEEAKPEDRPGS